MIRRPASSVLTLALLLMGGTLAAAERPPRDLHQEPDGHWTAWNPPTSLPPDAQVHIVVPGDTLWDLAGRYYGDPYLWPQLWEQNRYILDAHWIYPGDPLLVTVEVTEAEDLAALEEAMEEGAAPGGPGGPPMKAPVPLGTESDIYCTGYVGELEEGFGYRIISSEYEALSVTIRPWQRGVIEGTYGKVGTTKYGLATGDIAYLDGGRAGGLSPGMLFTVVEPGERVLHPATGEAYGRMYRYTGRLRVLSVQAETAIAEIVHSCDAIVVGSGLKPFEPEPVPLKRRTMMRPLNLPVEAERLVGSPVIIASHDKIFSLGQGHVVFIDQGTADGVAPGDIYTVYRMHRPGLPPVVIGELAVLSVHPRSSVAKILESRYAVYIGDHLDPK